MELQYQLSNGSWYDCGITDQNRAYNKRDRTAEFLAMCIAEGKSQGRDEAAVMADLAAGKTVRNDKNDWYSNCRIKPAPVAPRAPDTRIVLHCKSCGQTGYCGNYPFSTNPESGYCDDCV